ncbi:16S rRNA (guanine(966)-N(2))-methyltransferase RsmD [Synechococcus sp. M16CYN]
MRKSAQLRLTGGRRLLSPAGCDIRPTTARVREAVMSILGSRLNGCYWLDLCSGSGVMGCEALQRGARGVVAIEKNPACARICTKNLQTVAESLKPKPRIRVVRKNVVSWLRQCRTKQPFNIVYFDPPYKSDLYSQVAVHLSHGCWLDQDALLVCEHSSSKSPELNKDWVVMDQRKYGASSLLMLSPRAHFRSGDTDSMPPQTGLRASQELNLRQCRTVGVRS